MYGNKSDTVEEGIIIKSMIGKNCSMLSIPNTKQFPSIENVDLVASVIS